AGGDEVVDEPVGDGRAGDNAELVQDVGGGIAVMAGNGSGELVEEVEHGRVGHDAPPGVSVWTRLRAMTRARPRRMFQQVRQSLVRQWLWDSAIEPIREPR